MKSKYFLSIGILSFGLIVSAFIAVNGASAQTGPANGGATPSIQYPVAELGNCANETACRSYCDDAANSAACLSFAEKHNLMSKNEVQLAKNFEKSGKKGPGGCTTKDSCETYCNDMANINECVSFAEQNNLMPKDQLVEAKKIQAAIAKGIKPPACKNKSDCDKYCSAPAHMEECITFGQAAGLMSEKDLQDSQKVLTAIKNGVKPPACNGKDECDKYCNDSAHIEECMTFAQAAGFMTPEEAKNSQGMLTAIKKGIKPPACRGKDECDKYCSDPVHTEECIAFSEAAGMMTSQEAAMARKTGGKGPGGCVGKDQCDAFCNNPDNQETCFNFGRDNGMIPQDQLQKMEEGKKQLASSLKQAPPQVLSCISGVVGTDRLEKFKSGALMPPRDIGDKIGECFRQGMGPGGPGEGGNIPPGQNGQNGQPGQFQPGPGNMNPGGQMMPQQTGPGGCKTPEECQSFCASNPDVCQNFRPSGEPGQIQIQGGTPGELQNFIEGAAGRMMQGIQPGAPMPGQAQQCAPGTQCGPGPNMSGQAPAGQPGVFIQTQPGAFVPQDYSGIPQGNVMPQGNMMQPGTSGGLPPPPDSSTPPPAGGSLIQSIQSFLGF
jgi:hypothetical protein